MHDEGAEQRRDILCRRDPRCADAQRPRRFVAERTDIRNGGFQLADGRHEAGEQSRTGLG
jgi:hypothetical protein